MEKKRFDVNLDDPQFTKARSPVSCPNPSYAQFVVQQNGCNVQYKEPNTETPSEAKSASSSSSSTASSSHPAPGGDDKKHSEQHTAMAGTGTGTGTGQKQEEADQRTEPEPLPAVSGTKPLGSGSGIIVSPRQKDPHNSLKELAHMCILADCTLILAWRHSVSMMCFTSHS
ncbi:hypothetical protein CRUP_004087 [Coryphaenoides rupestris]|nr:hypothetical protein CRUP_004087 [Coryphaenoides rupestris]